MTVPFVPESAIEDAKAKFGKGEAWIIYKRDSDDDDWKFFKVVNDRQDMELYIDTLNDRQDYQRFSMDKITID